ncbi:MAG: carbamoyltransferase HypF [Hydrogenophilales bacterium CG_4_9_14_3_um_filter_63_34]|nr:MAG: carbamoyltransferase HypF [Hydrogenophilales bacterium CG_4_10_14_3_um_filter_63_21]PJB03087.1 MAG: carbamoyltransferase HypF [Hydrogenophilales bacterium CG_4_9_14_3_um_filter_63_34]
MPQRRLRVTGIVQGVGFRPTVWHLARELKLVGWVRNDAAGVEVRLEGDAAAIADFTRRLPKVLPPLAQVRDLAWSDTPATGEFSEFSIVESGAGQAATLIGPDTAVCRDCLAELFDPADRRWRYAFINCTHCGPRYTLTRRLPYDRAQTSMAAFPLCPDCEREYRDPANRRFHAEPTACAVCGPRLWLEPATLQRLQSGQIVAIKGLGGFHLACDARNGEAVRRLRERKNREEKPFAAMAANLASIADWVEISAEEAALLQSPERPIVLLRKKPGVDAALPGVAPGLAWLGVMLPYTPIHWLLFHEAAGRPAGTAWMDAPHSLLLVMTSGNPGGEPLVIGNDEAVERLAGIADAVLLHDRDIVARCDDSVVRVGGRQSAVRSKNSDVSGNRQPPIANFQFIRRARGYTPRAIRLASAGPSVLALGGYLKNTICVTRGDEAFVSQHIGGLNNPAACAMLMEVTAHLLDILQARPEAVAHDLHPDFFSSRHALELAERWAVPAIAVQHHHAHIAAIAAEHDVSGPLLGLALDGVGLGSDGGAWGGELLRVEGANFIRLGHLSPIPLPGGDKAASQPWRMAAAALHLLGRGGEIARRFPGQPAAASLARLLAGQTGGLQPALHTTSSLGRWFDAAAGLLGVREAMAYEGQAAMLLEGLAEQYGAVEPLAGGFVLQDDGSLDLLPLLARLADEKDAVLGAKLFHATLAQGLAEWLERAAAAESLNTVALGGGCFLNHLLSRELTRLLAARGYTVLSARQAPPNDGGLSLGQAWVAMLRSR